MEEIKKIFEGTDYSGMPLAWVQNLSIVYIITPKYNVILAYIGVYTYRFSPQINSRDRGKVCVRWHLFKWHGSSINFTYTTPLPLFCMKGGNLASVKRPAITLQQRKPDRHTVNYRSAVYVRTNP